jgi:hypothetical protein
MAPDESDRDVLKSLPRTRPQRRSSKRDGAAKKAAAAPKPKAATATEAKSAAKPRAKTKRAAPTPIASKRKRSGARPRRMPPAGFSPPRDTRDQSPPSGAELIGTAIQAAAELAQIGLAVGGHALRSAMDRLPKP